MSSENVLYNLLERNNSLFPNATALICNDIKLSYEQLIREVDKVVHFFNQLNLKKGERVAINYENSIEFAIVLYACLKKGLVFVPINPDTPDEKYKYILQNCAASVCFTDKVIEYDELVAWVYMRDNIIQELPCKVYTWKEIMTAKEYMISKCQAESSDIALIIYTSGTTGKPKGVVEKNENVLFAVKAINEVIKNQKEDVILCGLPLSFDYGLYQLFLACEVGACVHILKKYDMPMSIPKFLKDNNITGLPLIPSIIAALLKSRLLERIELPKLRYVTSTGDIFPLNYIKNLSTTMPHVTIYPMYGLTECKRVSIYKFNEGDIHKGSVGRPLKGTIAKIVNDNGEEVPNGCEGELVIEGNNVMSGYWNDEELTKKRFSIDETNQSRILFTNDLFRKDDEGYLYYVGRNEMIIKSRGKRFSPIEIEDVITEIEGVIQVCVFGIQNEFYGEEIIAVIVENPDTHLQENSIIEFCEKRLEHEAIPRKIFFQTELLDITHNGKVDRRKLKSNYELLAYEKRVK